MNYQGAVRAFRFLYPNGFQDADYIAKVRTPKVRVKRLLETTVPPMEDVAGGVECTDEVLGMFNRCSRVLLHWKEAKSMTAALKESPRRNDIPRMLADFAMGDLNALRGLERLLRDYRAHSWPIVTCLPFLWDTKTPNMFIRKTPTVAFTELVDWTFQYDSQLSGRPYKSVTDLCMQLPERESGGVQPLLGAFVPGDVIDIQGMIWTCGLARKQGYEEGSFQGSLDLQDDVVLDVDAGPRRGSDDPELLESDRAAPMSGRGVQRPARRGYPEEPAATQSNPDQTGGTMPEDTDDKLTDERFDLLVQAIKLEREAIEDERAARREIHDRLDVRLESMQGTLDLRAESMETKLADGLSNFEKVMNTNLAGFRETMTSFRSETSTELRNLHQQGEHQYKMVMYGFSVLGAVLAIATIVISFATLWSERQTPPPEATQPAQAQPIVIQLPASPQTTPAPGGAGGSEDSPEPGGAAAGGSEDAGDEGAEEPPSSDPTDPRG